MLIIMQIYKQKKSVDKAWDEDQQFDNDLRPYDQKNQRDQYIINAEQFVQSQVTIMQMGHKILKDIDNKWDKYLFSNLTLTLRLANH